MIVDHDKPRDRTNPFNIAHIRNYFEDSGLAVEGHPPCAAAHTPGRDSADHLVQRATLTPQAASIVKHYVEQRTVDLHSTGVVFDESELSEAVHEEADAGPGGADHFGERLLADLGNNRLRLVIFAEMRKQ